MTAPAPAPKPIRVTAEDPETGDRQTSEVHPGDYCLIPVEPLFLAVVQKYGNGTVVLTLKRRTP